jgi:hypothetical protein
MNNFYIYFQIGFKHIANVGAMDHILFMMALALRYQFADWKKLLVLITAFTIGHTITLGLCVLDIIYFSKHWIEFLIPATIAVTAFSNLFVKKFNFNQPFPLIYWFALFFGLIHGLGFSNYIQSLLGKEQSIIQPLISFNIGLEVGQIFVVFITLFIMSLIVYFFKVKHKSAVLVISGIIIGACISMFIERLFELYV